MTAELPPKLTQPVGERDHTRGLTTAPVTLVEYGDYECQHCRLAYPIVRELREQLGDQLRFAFRHFPATTVHPHAQLAAEAAEAAAAQGMFWEMHGYLFEHRHALEIEDLVGYAAALGLDTARFEHDLREHVHAERVREDFLSGVRSGVNGTPTFFINGQRYDGAWDLESLLEAIEKPLGVRVQLLAQRFTQLAASGGIVLLASTILALLWANSTWASAYFQLWETNLAIAVGDRAIAEHLLEWVNDGLMVIFFFVVGLEIKREVTVGQLASPKRAALPIAAALGGMILPAAIYAALNRAGPGSAGWGIPMATDIAFTLGILTVLGRRVPFSLKVFFTALAIADDLGAVLVIALFYTSGISWAALGLGALILALLVGLNRARVYSPLPYALLGIGLWVAFLQSGVHPTIAGVLLALTIPTRSPANTGTLLAQCVTTLSEFETLGADQHSLRDRHQAVVQTLETITNRLQSPAHHLEHILQPWTTYLILPLFALANAGVAFGADMTASLVNPVSVGIIFGLVIGKPLGITLFAWLAAKLRLAELPAGVSWAQIFSASWLAGIGFTISLFISDAAFDDPVLLSAAKLAILIASVVSGLAGWILLSLTSPSYDETTPASQALATP